MKVTNIYNLPDGFYQACKRDFKRRENTYHATEILKGATEIVLTHRYGDEVEVDCSEMLWAIFGTAVHKVMENHTVGDNEVSEMRLEADAYGSRLVGRMDLYEIESETITDYKTCSVWKIIFGDYEDWKKQTLVYKWLLRENGLDAKRSSIVAMIKDHSKRDAKYKGGYPKLPVERVDFELSEDDYKDIDVFIRDKIIQIKTLEKTNTVDLPPCSPKERWAKEDTFAVKKDGRKSALRVLPSKEDAEEWMISNVSEADRKKCTIEYRQGEDVKCKEYCNVCTYCPYWIKTYGNGGE